MRNTRFILAAFVFAPHLRAAEDLGAMWGTAAEEAKYYPIVNIPVPPGVPMRPGGMEILPDGRLAIGTRRGDIYFIKGAFEVPPQPEYHLFASGQDEIFSLAWKDGAMTATTWGEVTRISDTNGDEVADRYDTLTSNWGYAEGHEFAFGSKPDAEGNIWVALGLSGSYESHNLFRGWAVKVTPDGKMIPVCSGLRSPGGVGANAEGAMFTIESQGPWNGCCSLKHLKPGGFLGHPASYNWYPYVPGMKAPALEPKSDSRMGVEKKRVKELVPPAVKFPYIKMGRSISGFRLNKTGGKFGPFDGQLFLGDYTQSIIMRATTELVNGVWQGACYPFREGLATGIMNVEFSPKGQLIAGGFTTNSQWPVRGTEPFALQRIDWNGVVPFEIKEINIRKDGFLVTFTKPVDRVTAAQADAWNITTCTHIYHGAYGSPEVDQTTARVLSAEPSADGLSARVRLEKIIEDHIHEFDLSKVASRDGQHLLHNRAYYTVNEIPQEPAPAGDSPQWLSYPGGDGPGKGKRIVLIAADQEYRSEQSMPMLAKILSTHHGFDCTVLFAVNGKGEVDPTMPVYPEKGKEFKEHHIPGLEQLASAELVIFFPRLLTLPMTEREMIVQYVDSGKPIISMRTGNHGFHAALPYKINGKQVDWGHDVLGGSFMGHHGRWQADSTRGTIVPEQKDHPILTGVNDIWGNSDVYRTYKEGASLPAGCTALVWGQPLMGRKQDDAPNPELEPLPVAWFKNWQTSGGKLARVFHSTMGSGHDLQNPGLRRLIINAAYWGMGMEAAITPARSVEIVGTYQPLESGFDYQKLGVVPKPVSAYK